MNLLVNKTYLVSSFIVLCNEINQIAAPPLINQFLVKFFVKIFSHFYFLIRFDDRNDTVSADFILYFFHIKIFFHKKFFLAVFVLGLD